MSSQSESGGRSFVFLRLPVQVESIFRPVIREITDWVFLVALASRTYFKTLILQNNGGYLIVIIVNNPEEFEVEAYIITYSLLRQSWDTE